MGQNLPRRFSEQCCPDVSRIMYLKEEKQVSFGWEAVADVVPDLSTNAFMGFVL